MRMYLLECPACGAKVEMETDRKSCFCTYCGNKVYLDDGTKRVEITKNINYHKTYTDEAKIRDIESRERMYDKKLAADEAHEKRKHKANRNSWLGLIAYAIVILVIGSVFFTSQKRESDNQEKALQSIVNEIMQDINDGNYSSAHIKVESLYYTAGWSDDIEKKWDATRKELIKQIDAAEDAAEKSAKEASKETKKAEKKPRPNLVARGGILLTKSSIIHIEMRQKYYDQNYYLCG